MGGKSSKKDEPTNQSRSEQDEIYKRVLIELILYVIFLITVSTVALFNRNFFMYYFYAMIQKVFIKRTFTGSNGIEIDFESISTVQDWWSFISMALQDGLTGQSLNMDKIDAGNGTETETGTGTETYQFYENILFSPPRLRQLKVKNETCIIQDYFKRYFVSCYGAYSYSNEDTSSRANSKYYSASEIDGIPIWGILHLYDGGGYVKDLTLNPEKNNGIVEKLKEDLWINRGARLIVFEFALYNANLNLFCIVKFLAEIPPVGSLILSYRINTFQLVFLWTALDYVYFFFYALFILQVIYYTVEEIIEIYQDKGGYFKQFWNWVDMVVCVIAYLCLAYVIFRYFYMKQILKTYEKNPKKHLSLDLIGFLQFHYNNMLGICAFLVWIKVLKYLSFSKAMMQFTTTLRRCAKDLLAFGFMFAIAFISFAQLGYLLFGTETNSFKNFPDAVFTMMRALLGDFEYDETEKANRILGPIFLLIYVIFVFFILLNMFLAIINDTYSEVKGEITADNLKLGSYIKRLLGKLCKWCCCGRNVCNFVDSDAEDAGGSGPGGITETPSRRGVVSPITGGARGGTGTDTSGAGAGPRSREAQLSPRQREMIEKYFQAVDSEKKPTAATATAQPKSMNDAELNRMNQRIQRLEEIMDRMVTRLDALVSRLDNARAREQGRRT